VKPRSATLARLPDFVEAMKAKLIESMPSGGAWIFEVKFDGYRALAPAAVKRGSYLATKRIWASNSQK
jgi:ATP-dependent DNA ligase